MRPGLTPSPPPATRPGTAGPSLPSLNCRGSAALSTGGSYPFCPRGAPSRRPGGGISARPGGRRPAGPAAAAEATWRRRGGALGLGEPGRARSTGASPGRTRGAFAAARARVWAAPGAPQPPGRAGAADRRAKGGDHGAAGRWGAAGSCLPCPGPAGSVGSAGPQPPAPRAGSRSLSGAAGGALRWRRCPRLEERLRAEALRFPTPGRPRGLPCGALE